MKSKLFAFLVGLGLSPLAFAATFPLFSPANGVLKGNASTFVTTAAVSSDIISMWTGTCNSTSFLRGDGACAFAVVAPAGADTQVQYNNAGAFGASSNFTFTSASNVLNLGASTTPGTFSVGSLDSMVVNGVAVPIPGFAINSNIQGVIENHSYVAGGPTGGSRYYGVRSRGSIAAPAIVQSGDNLNSIYAAGYNGTNYSLAGQILFTVGNVPGAADMPGDLDFLLSPDGSQTPTSRLKLFNTGAIGISGSQGTSGNVLTSTGTGTAAAWGTVALGSVNAVSGTLGVANGGTNLTTATDDNVMVGNGTTWQSKSVPACTDTTGNHLNYDAATNTFSCGTSAPGGLTGFANPTASLGLTAVNGVATTAMRSDAAPALSQSIAPTWTAQHIFNKAGEAVTVKGDTSLLVFRNTANTGVLEMGTVDAWAGAGSTTDAAIGAVAALNLYAGNGTTAADYSITSTHLTHTFGGQALTGTLTTLTNNTSTVSGDRSRVSVSAGSTNVALLVANQNEAGSLITNGPTGPQGALRGLGSYPLVFGTNNSLAFEITATQALQGWGPTAGAVVDMTPDTGTFTLTGTGFTASVTCTARWVRMGNVATLYQCQLTGTSNATTFTGTGLPAAITPTRSQQFILSDAIDSGATQSGTANVIVGTGGTLTYLKVENASGWTNSGTKANGPATGQAFTYILN